MLKLGFTGDSKAKVLVVGVGRLAGQPQVLPLCHWKGEILCDEEITDHFSLRR